MKKAVIIVSLFLSSIQLYSQEGCLGLSAMGHKVSFLYSNFDSGDFSEGKFYGGEYYIHMNLAKGRISFGPKFQAGTLSTDTLDAYYSNMALHIDYSFINGRFSPFVGLSAGIGDGFAKSFDNSLDDVTSLHLNFQLGAKFYLTDRTAIFTTYNLVKSKEPSDAPDTHWNYLSIGLHFDTYHEKSKKIKIN